MATNRTYRVSVRVRFKFELFRNTFCFLDRTVFRDYAFDPRGFILGLDPWLDEIRKYSSFDQFLTSPEVEIIENQTIKKL